MPFYAKHFPADLDKMVDRKSFFHCVTSQILENIYYDDKSFSIFNIFYCVSLQTRTGCHKNLLVIRKKCDVIQYPVL